MSKSLPERMRALASSALHLAPGWCACAAAAFTPPVFTLPLLLLGNALIFGAIAFSTRESAESRFALILRHRVPAYLVLLAAYTVLAALAIIYPVQLLLRDHSLQAALLLSGALFVLLILPWRWWPAFGLTLIWDDAIDPIKRPAFASALARSWAFAIHLTGWNDIFFADGLIVSLIQLLLAAGALALSGIIGAIIPAEMHLLALGIYALAFSPLAHWLIGRCSIAALRSEQPQPMKDESVAVAAAKEAPVVDSVIDWPRFDQARGIDEMNAELLQAARTGQTAAALAALAEGADAQTEPASGDRDQRSVLVLACLHPDLRLLRELIARGADVSKAHAGLAPLIAVTRDSQYGRPDAVMTLLTNGADARCVDAEGNTPLHYAARAAQPVVAALLCDAGAAVDAINHEGLTPLAIACMAGNCAMAKFLLERHAKPEAVHAQPALLAAASAIDDDPELVKLLLKHRAHVDARDAVGRTALINAALHGNADIAAALLKAGAQVDLADERGTTALLEAARAGASDVIDVLAAYAPAPDHTDRLGRTALMLAAQSAQADEGTLQRLLALGASRSLATPEGRRAADFAATAGRWNLVTVLDPDYALPASVGESLVATAHAPDQTSPAHLLDALRFAHWTIVENFASRLCEYPMAQRAQLFVELAEHDDARALRWLLEHGLDANAQLDDGRSLLSRMLASLPATLAATRELLDAGAQAGGIGMLDPVFDACAQIPAQRTDLVAIAHVLVERGADIFATDARGQTPLARAAALGDAQLARALLARGADPNTRNRHGRTPLFCALAHAPSEAVPLVQALVRAGADPELASANGETPLGIALAQSPDIAQWLNWTQWLLPKRAMRDADLPAAAKLGDIAAVGKLLDLGLPVDAADAQGATALIHAAGAGHAELVERLLDRGARLDSATTNGATALSAAVSARREIVVAAMLERGIEANQRLPGGGTVLMIAAALGYPEIIARLVARGADVNAEDARGTRALHAAAQFAFANRDTARARRVLEILIEKGAALDAVDAKGRSALLYLLGARAEPGSVADQQHLQSLLALFLVGRANVNLQDERGVSALHACAMHGLVVPARALLAARADSECQDVLGRTPRQVASLLGYVDVAAELGLRAAPMPLPGQPAALR